MYKKLIFNIVTLMITSFLLILTLMAWYTSNDEVKATGVTGRVQDQEQIIEQINVYYATRVNDTTYTKGDLVSNGDQMIYDQFPEVYDPSTHGDVLYHEPPRLVELVLKQGKQLDLLDMVSDTDIFPGMDNTENRGYVVKDPVTEEVSIPLSPFLKFNKATLNGTTISITEFDGYEYDESTGNASSTTIRLINEAISPRVYLLFDFDDEKFNILYSNNIGNADVDLADQINHYNDFKLFVSGGNIQ